MNEHAEKTTYDLETELQAERAYWRGLFNAPSGSAEAILECSLRIRRLVEELESRGVTRP